MILKKYCTLFNPEQFQGARRKCGYFEGWYYKVINAEGTKAFAFIPGIALDNNGNKQAFIQVLDGKKQLSKYHAFAIEDFKATPGFFRVSILENLFLLDSISLDLPDVRGHLRFQGVVPWPKHWYSPGIMGPYAFVPFMECYHGIVSMDHAISGRLEVNGEIIDFENGRGYTEKDWGRSFPSAYVWMQSNHFREPGISIKVSVARIPWVGRSFVGFIGGIWIHDHLIQFTTYNHSVLRMLHINSNRVELVMENKKYRLEIAALRNAATALASPIRGMMDGRIEESMTSIIELSLIDMRTGKSVLRDNGRNAGLEVAGKIEEIVSP
jgi:tocopherol cyclase